MGNLSFLTRAEIDSLGPPIPEELDETGISQSFLRELALKHVASIADPTTASVAEKLRLPHSLTDELLFQLYREKLIEIRLQSALGLTRYAMLDHGWERVARLQNNCAYSGPAPVTLDDYSYMVRLQASPSKPASIKAVCNAFRDLVLPLSLIEMLGCAVNSRSSLFLTGLPGTGKTAIAERINGALHGSIWIPYAVEIDNQIIRIYDRHLHKTLPIEEVVSEYDKRWIRIERPMVVRGGELTLENTDLVWSESSRYYEAPFQMKANGGTLVIDELGRQRVSCKDLLNRWIVPLEKRIDFLTLHNGKKIEVPFEQLTIFSTNLDEDELVDEAFLRRMGYRAHLELPTSKTYSEIWRRAATAKGLTADESLISYVLSKYEAEKRSLRCCEPHDLMSRIGDICAFEGRKLQLSPALLDAAWANYFGAAHRFEAKPEVVIRMRAGAA